MAAAAETKFKVEEVGPCRKKISITIPPAKVREQLTSSLDVLTHEASVPGFRKGRAPKHLVQKRFGKAVRDEARNQLVAAAYSEAIKEHELAVIGEPEGADELADLDLTEDTTISFAVEVDVAPEFDTPDLSKVELLKPQIDVTEKMVDDQVQRMGLNYGELEPQDSASPGDYYIGHGVMKAKGSDDVIIDIADAVVQIPAEDSDGAGAILGVKVKDFAKQLGTPGRGDAVTVKVKGPENHENPAVRGKDLIITYTPDRIERIIGASPAQLCERFGLIDEKQLRETITLQLNRRAMIEQQAALRSQVARHLVKSIDFDLPKRLTDSQAARNIERARLEMMYRGLDEHTVEERLADVRASSDDQARRQLKLFFIVAKVAKEKDVKVSESEVNGRIAQLAAERGVPAHQLREDIIRRGQAQVIVNQLREHKVLDTLIQQAKVKDIPLDEFNKKMGGAESAESAADV